MNVNHSDRTWAFVIQVSNPITASTEIRQVADLAEAVFTLFPMNTEYAILLWNSIPIRLSYKYDISVLIDDLVPLLEDVASSEEGKTEVYWGSDTFRGKWEVSWHDDELLVMAIWDGIAGSYENVVNERGRLLTWRSVFLGEWGGLLRKVLEATTLSEIRIMDDDLVLRAKRLLENLPPTRLLYPWVAG